MGVVQIWSANPFSHKKTSSCSPALHRTPVMRRGSLLPGAGWFLANEIPRGAFPRTRRWALERTAKSLGAGKYRAFRRAAAATGNETAVLFFGDSAQGDAHAARRMLSDRAHGTRAWAFVHDLTREVVPGEVPRHVDERIAIKQPFRRGEGEGGGDPSSQRRAAAAAAAWRSPRMNYYKTVPEAAFLLAQLGFLDRDSLRRVVDATNREIRCPFNAAAAPRGGADAAPQTPQQSEQQQLRSLFDLDGNGFVKRSERNRRFAKDEVVLERLRREGRLSACPLKTLIRYDVRKCEALIRNDDFWAVAGGGGLAVAARPDRVSQQFACLAAGGGEARAKTTDEVSSRHVSSVARTAASRERARRAAAYRARRGQQRIGADGAAARARRPPLVDSGTETVAARSTVGAADGGRSRSR